jgi:hypothetical protein
VVRQTDHPVARHVVVTHPRVVHRHVTRVVTIKPAHHRHYVRHAAVQHHGHTHVATVRTTEVHRRG